MRKKLFLLLTLMFLAAGVFSQGKYLAQPLDHRASNVSIAEMMLTSSRDVGDPVDIGAAMFAGADYLVHAQADVTEDNAGNGDPDSPDDPDDGGWDWSSAIFTHSTSASPINIYGATAQGLYYAYLQDNDPNYFTAMEDAADIMIGNPNIRSAADLVFLMNFQDLTGATADIYKDAAKAKFDARIAFYGSATALAEYIRDLRAGQGYENGIIPWDIGTWAVAAQMLEDRYPTDPYDYATAADDIAQVIWEDSFNNNPGYFDPDGNNMGFDPTGANKDYWWYTLGITGIIDAFEYADVHTTEIADMMVILDDCQYTGGAFSDSYGANPDDESWQATAYAVKSIALVDQTTYQAMIDHACYWLAATQDEASGAWVYSSGNHYPEVGGEITAALSFGENASVVYVDDDYTEGGANDGYLWGYDAFASIQDGIDGVAEGGIVNVAGGTYAEKLIIDKSVDLRGPNYGVDPNTGSRNTEAIIEFPSGLTDYQDLVFITGDDVIIDGFTLDGQTYTPAEGTEGVMGYSNNIEIKNNIIANFNYVSVWITSYHPDYPNPSGYNFYREGLIISDNYIHNADIFNATNGSVLGYGIYLQGTYGTISGNVVEDTKDAIQVQPYNHPNTSNVTGTVSGNTFEGYREPIWFNYSENANADWSFTGNTLNGIAAPTGVTEAEWRGFRIQTCTADGSLSFSGNTINMGSTNATDVYALRKWNNVVTGMIDLDATFANNTWERCAAITDGTNIIDPASTDTYFYSYIQDAIDGASSGNTVEVVAGTYFEAGQMVIDKNLSIIGEDKATTFLKPDHDTYGGGYATTEGWIYVEPGISFTLENFTLDGRDLSDNNQTIKMAIQSRGELTVENCVFQNMLAGTYDGRGIVLLSGSNNYINNVSMSNIGRIGIHVRGSVVPPSPVAEIYNFTYVGKGNGDFLDYGIEFGGGGQGTVGDINTPNSGCNITNNYGVASTDGSVSAGILVTDYYGTFTIANINSSTLTDNSNGIVIGYDTPDISEVTVRNSKIYGNADYGISALENTSVDAENNWWGHASGPLDASDDTGTGGLYNPLGQGDAVTDYVDYDPWWADEAGTITATTEETAVYNVDQGVYYSSIQDAILAADLGDEIQITGENNTKNITVNKGLKIAAGNGGANFNGFDPGRAGIGFEVDLDAGEEFILDGTEEELIVENYTTAVLVYPTNEGDVTIKGVKFLTNDFAIENNSTVTVDADSNYWGTINYDNIVALMAGTGVVDFTPYSDEAFLNYYEGPGPITTIPALTNVSPCQVHVPVTVADFANVGGISLILNFTGPFTLASVDLNDAIATADVNILTNKMVLGFFSTDPINLDDNDVLFTLMFDYTGTACPDPAAELVLSWDDTDPTFCEYSTPEGHVFWDEPFSTYYVGRTITVADVANPVATTPAGKTIEGCDETTALPEPISINVGPDQAPDTYYTDRYPPYDFSVITFGSDDVIKHSINEADCEGCRPGGLNGSFYNTQGRKYDTPGALSLAIDLYIPSDWETTGRRMAGVWGTAFNASDAISLYPIVEFTSDNSDPRFRCYNNGVWIDMGLPSGFTYNSWYTISMRLVGTEVLYTVGDIQETIPYNNSAYFGNMILQGHNTVTPGVTYDIYWRNFKTSQVKLPYSETEETISESQYSAELGSATDNCFGLTITYQDSKEFTCPTVVTRTFTFTDACGNETTTTQMIEIDDTTDPTITCPAPLTVYMNDGCFWSGIGLGTPVTDDNCTVANVVASVSATPIDPLTYQFPLGTTIVTWTVTDGCGNFATCTQDVTVNYNTISGTLNLYKSTPVPMEGIVVTATDGVVTESATVDEFGAFTVPDICQGTYTLSFTNTNAPGSINATDAAQANYWAVGTNGLYPIEYVRFLAGDVSGPDDNVTSIDAGRIQQYFVYGTAFDKAPWSYWFVNTWVNSNPQNLGALQVAVIDAPVSGIDLYGMVTGDFNTSYTLTTLKALAANVILRYDNTYELGANMETTLPVRMINPAEVSAMSLVFQVPTDLMEVTDVTMNASHGQFDWAVVGNELRIGWNAAQAISFEAGETLATIHLTTSESFVQGEIIRLKVTPDPVNELADASLAVVLNAELGIDVLEANALGIGDPSLSNALNLRTAPNPFGEYTFLSYSLPADGHVNLEISTIYGMKVATLVDDLQTAGNYRLKLDAAGLSAGVYMATIRLNGTDLDRVQTIKLVLNR